MKPSFDIPENRPAAVFLAAALTLATFSILPISLAGVEMSKKPAEYVRVHSFAGASEPAPKPSPRPPRGLRAFSAPAALDAPPFASKLAVPVSPEIVEAPPEFLSGGAAAGNFSFGEAPGEAFANAAFELSELDSVPAPPESRQNKISAEALPAGRRGRGAAACGDRRGWARGGSRRRELHGLPLCGGRARRRFRISLRISDKGRRESPRALRAAGAV